METRDEFVAEREPRWKDLERLLADAAAREPGQGEATRLMRKHWGFVAVATVLFWLPFALGLAGALFRPGFAEHVLPPETLEAMNTWYAKSESRPDGGDSAMAGFYVYNNVGIAFRC